jgi:hypothetical protein
MSILKTANVILFELRATVNKCIELSRDKTYSYSSRVSFEHTEHTFIQRTMCRFEKPDGGFTYSMGYWIYLKGIGARNVMWNEGVLTDEEADNQIWLYCLDWVYQWIKENTAETTTVVEPSRVDLKKENFPWGNTTPADADCDKDKNEQLTSQEEQK